MLQKNSRLFYVTLHVIFVCLLLQCIMCCVCHVLCVMCRVFQYLYDKGPFVELKDD